MSFSLNLVSKLNFHIAGLIFPHIWVFKKLMMDLVGYSLKLVNFSDLKLAPRLGGIWEGVDFEAGMGWALYE